MSHAVFLAVFSNPQNGTYSGWRAADRILPRRTAHRPAASVRRRRPSVCTRDSARFTLFHYCLSIGALSGGLSTLRLIGSANRNYIFCATLVATRCRWRCSSVRHEGRHVAGDQIAGDERPMRAASHQTRTVIFLVERVSS